MGKAICLLPVIFLVIFAATSPQVVADVIAPAGLTPGSQYQLIFVTFSTTTATSSDIDYYDSFVAGEAAFGASFGLPTGVAWHAVASTETVSAKDNAPSNGLPVYNTRGELVAASTIYSGSLLTAVRYDETGTSYGLDNAAVWTGSDAFGVGASGLTLGGPGENGVVGYAGGADHYWLDDSAVWLGNSWALYALSDPITVPVPEPATLTLLASAFLAFGGFRLFRPSAHLTGLFMDGY